MVLNWTAPAERLAGGRLAAGWLLAGGLGEGRYRL